MLSHIAITLFQDKWWDFRRISMDNLFFSGSFADFRERVLRNRVRARITCHNPSCWRSLWIPASPKMKIERTIHMKFSTVKRNLQRNLSLPWHKKETKVLWDVFGMLFPWVSHTAKTLGLSRFAPPERSWVRHPDEEFLLWHIPSVSVPIPNAICKLFGLFFFFALNTKIGDLIWECDWISVMFGKCLAEKTQQMSTALMQDSLQFTLSGWCTMISCPTSNLVSTLGNTPKNSP